MLQRTRAEQVVPVYSKFIEKYPTFTRLSQARSQEVISLFARLGLKWRAKRVVKLIRVLEWQYRGKVPHDLEELTELPGVGNYVAKAVLCYAFGRRVAPIDSNVVRVISRLYGLGGTADMARRDPKMAELTESLIPENRARDFNLSLLDFAALVCKPRPMCPKCPLKSYCTYYDGISDRSPN
jgi:A/G-specific adenine glycosylase